VLAEIVQRVGHHLHRASAAAGGRPIDLGHAITCRAAGLTSGNHVAESRDTDHVLAPGSRLHCHEPWCHCLGNKGTHCKVRQSAATLRVKTTHDSGKLLSSKSLVAWLGYSRTHEQGRSLLPGDDLGRSAPPTRRFCASLIVILSLYLP
jgi:hypothetical protein